MRIWRLFLTTVLLCAVVPAALTAASPEAPYDATAFGPPGALRIDVQGDLAAVSYSAEEGWTSAPEDGVAFFDISEPAAPALLGFYPTEGQPWDIQLDGDRLYEAREGVGLVIWDVTDPAAASEIGTASVAADFALDVDGDVAYVGQWSPPTLYAIGVGMPSSPVVLDSIALPSGNLSTIEAQHPLVFVGTRNGGQLTSIDAGDPADLTLLDSEPGDIVDMVLSSDRVYSAGTSMEDLGAWDVSLPKEISKDATRTILGGGWTVDVDDGRAFLGSGDAEIVVYDLSTPEDPSEQRVLPLGARPWDVDVEGDHAWVAAGEAGAMVARIPTGLGLDVTQGVEGATRYETAIQASRVSYPFGAATVLIATGMDWPDALGGSALAGATYGPVLLTRPDSLPDNVFDEVRRLDPERAYVLGGQAAVSPAVAAALEVELGEENVVRLGGANRYETAELIAEETWDRAGHPSMVVVATGLDYPDAIAGSPLSSSWQMPVFLTPSDALPDSTRQAISDIAPDGALVLGGTGVVGPGVVAELESVVGAGNVTRLAGADRYATAASIAEYGDEKMLLSFDNVALATGESFADALTGGVLQGREKSVLLLTRSSSLSGAAASRLSAHTDAIGRLRYLGGTAAVSQDVRDQAESMLR